MPNITTFSIQNNSPEPLIPPSAKPAGKKETLLPLFINQIVSPSHLKPSERLPSRTTPIEITLPPPKIKDSQSNWFEIVINPRNEDKAPQQGLAEWLPDPIEHLEYNNKPNYNDINYKLENPIDIKSESPNTINEIELQNNAAQNSEEWLQDLLKNYENYNINDNFNYEFEGAVTIKIESIDFRDEKNVPSLQNEGFQERTPTM